jgi:hypothetical protein
MIQAFFRANTAVVGLTMAEAMMGADGVAAMSVTLAFSVPLFNICAVTTLETCRDGKVHLKPTLLGIAKNPLIIVSDEDIALENTITINATINERDLHIESMWQKKIMLRHSNKHLFLVINGLDNIEADEQDKFTHLLKDRRSGTFKLPDYVQIVIPVKDKEKVSKQIKSLSLLWEVK